MILSEKQMFRTIGACTNLLEIVTERTTLSSLCLLLGYTSMALKPTEFHNNMPIYMCINSPWQQ